MRTSRQISREPETFISSERLVIRAAGSGDGGANDPSLAIPNLIAMDPPEHGKYRATTNRRFSPRGMRILEERIDEIAERAIGDAAAHIVDEVSGRRQADFVADVAAKMPMAAICEMLGVERAAWADIFHWTNEFLGAEDPEYQQGRTRRETWQSGMRGLMGTFRELIEQRRVEPADDVMTTLVEAKIDGEPLSEMDILSYAILLILAGNETTRNATSGGLLALIEHPEQFDRLRRGAGAVGQRDRGDSALDLAGDSLCADGDSGCGDPWARCFARGRRWRCGTRRRIGMRMCSRSRRCFDIGRAPNEHLAFGGYGEHFCLGANAGASGAAGDLRASAGAA